MKNTFYQGAWAGEKQGRVSVGNAKHSRGAPQPVRATEVKKPSVGSTFGHTMCRMLCKHKAVGQMGPLNTLSTTPAIRECIPAQTQRTKSAAWSHCCRMQMACLSGMVQPGDKHLPMCDPRSVHRDLLQRKENSSS